MDVFLPICFSDLKLKDKEVQINDNLVDFFLSRIIKNLADSEVLFRKEVFFHKYKYLY